MLFELEIKTVLNIYFDNVVYNGSDYNFKCNVCGDGINKKRAHIYTNDSGWMFYCFNGGCISNNGMSAIQWLKIYFPSEYKTALREYFKIKESTEKKFIIESIKKQSELINFKKNDDIINFDEKSEVRYFKKFLHFPNLIKYCEDRLIPYDVYSNWYFATDGFYKNRIIIPFINNKNSQIYYYQGRDINKNSKLKYLSRIGKNLNSIYNYYNVDLNMPVICLEGPIDSIFVENSIGITGLKEKNELLKLYKNKKYLFDNDIAGKSKSLQLLLKNEYVFNWCLFLKKYPCEVNIKDINDFIIYNTYNIKFLTLDLINSFFTNNVFHKIFFM